MTLIYFRVPPIFFLLSCPTNAEKFENHSAVNKWRDFPSITMTSLVKLAKWWRASWCLQKHTDCTWLHWDSAWPLRIRPGTTCKTANTSVLQIEGQPLGETGNWWKVRKMGQSNPITRLQPREFLWFQLKLWAFKWPRTEINTTDLLKPNGRRIRAQNPRGCLLFDSILCSTYWVTSWGEEGCVGSDKCGEWNLVMWGEECSTIRSDGEREEAKETLCGYVDQGWHECGGSGGRGAKLAVAAPNGISRKKKKKYVLRQLLAVTTIPVNEKDHLKTSEFVRRLSGFFCSCYSELSWGRAMVA